MSRPRTRTVGSARRLAPLWIALLGAVLALLLAGTALAAGTGGAAAPPAPGSTGTPAAPAATAITTPNATAPAVTPGVGTANGTVAPRASKGGGGVSRGAILAAVLAALLALACIVWAVFRFSAREPHWLLSARHSLAEAGFRASATWAEFTDWLRLGH